MTERGAPTRDAALVFLPCVDTWRRVLAHAESALPRALHRVTREAAALRQAEAIAGSATPIIDPLQRILEAALPVLPADHLVLLRASNDRTESVIMAAAGTAHVWRGLRVPLGRGLAARAIETGEAQLADAATDPDDGSAGQLTRSGLVVPVILHGRVFGVLATADERRRLTERHVRLLRAFADQCAIAIDNTRDRTRVGSW